ncbi:MAG: HIT family hydrolase [Thermoleophilia bacterium]|nr:HIT family hydrolase [Thermoleophilia bacterium]
MGERENPIAAALRGENPMVMTRMRTGFAVIGDTQHLPGYSLLLSDRLDVDHLSDLPWPARRDFLLDLSLVGEAVFAVTRKRGARRINYEVLGNSWPHLHGHVHSRYEWEPRDKLGGPVWRYPREQRDAPEHAYDEARHGELRAAITAELKRLVRAAYATPDVPT